MEGSFRSVYRNDRGRTREVPRDLETAERLTEALLKTCDAIRPTGTALEDEPGSLP
jgi:hypothetical protein